MVQIFLLTFGILDDIIGLLRLLQAALVAVFVLVLKDDLNARRADIDRLKDMQEDAELKAAELPGALRSVAVDFGASAKAAAALAERELDALISSMQRWEKFDWELPGGQVQPAHGPTGRTAAAPALARAAGSGGAN